MSELKNALSGMADHDLAEWLESFRQWRSFQTMHRPGCDDAGSVKFLHRDYVDWCTSCDEIPATLPTFEKLLLADGWQIVNGFVLGLFLKADLWALERPNLQGEGVTSWH